MSAVLVANLVATLVMVGMIATIHVVHYPLFAHVGAERYSDYMASHRSRIAALIALPWAAEGVTSLWLVLAPPAGVSRALAVAGLALAAVPVALTVGWAVGAHTALAERFDRQVHRRLMTANAARVIAWTAHAAVAVAMLLQTS